MNLTKSEEKIEAKVHKVPTNTINGNFGRHTYLSKKIDKPYFSNRSQSTMYAANKTLK